MKKTALDKSKLSSGDVLESGYMLEACATLMRQSFGIVCMFNDLAPDAMSDSELKTFAQHFDIVHKACRVYAKALFDFSQKLKDETKATSGS